jgi:tripartite-type tricarboxylate transporter receptor subunit TctC
MKTQFGAVALLGCLLVSPSAFAQSYPERSVTIVVSTSAGALTDVLARAVGNKLSERWKRPVVIDNKPGGAYAIAANAVIAAPADGHTLLASEIGMMTTQPHLHPKGRETFNPKTDFVPVSGMAGIPMAIVAHPSLEAKSVRELIELAKKKPGTINYGTSGPGTAPHMGSLLLENMAGIKMSPIHYKGVAPALNDVLAGHIDLITMGPSIALPHYRSGKLNILGLGSKTPVSQLKGIPVIGDTLPGYEAAVSFALFARAGTPMNLVEKINADVQAVLRDPEFEAFLDKRVLQPDLGSQAEFAKRLESQFEMWGKLIRDTNLKIE